MRKVTFREWAGQGRAPYRTDYAYDIENRPTQIGYGLTAQERDNTKITYSYDGLGRTATRTVKVNGTPCAANYTYLPGGHGEGSTTGLISAITQGSGDNAENFTYTYDNVGNISSVTQNGKLTSYEYDPLGQLIRVNDQNDTTSGENGTTWTYEYDLGGNILNKKRYAYTTEALHDEPLETVTYAYTDNNWKDKLTEFNGSYITYDEIGNPTSDGEWLYAWEKGRQLKAMSKANETIVFEYNADGLRVKKIATSTGTTNYTLHGKNIVHLTNGQNTLHFFYDAAGKPAIVEWNNGATTQKFAYIHNLQGDIIALIDSTGTKVVSYTYDAWGKPLSTTGSLANTLGKLNPFRYRGYVYDEETGIYYLRSRYYNSTWGRFINADSLIGKVSQLFSHNVFCYCSNIFVRMVDKNGNTYVDSLSEYYYEIEKYYAEVPEGDYKFSSSFINDGLGRLKTPYSSCRCSTLIDSAAGQRTFSKGMSTMMKELSVVCGKISENIGYEDLLPGTVLCKLATYEEKAYTGGVFDPKKIVSGDVTHGGIILDVYYKDNNKIIKVLQSTQSGPNGTNGVMITEFTEEKMKQLNWNTWLWRKNVIPDYLEWRVID